MSATSGQVTKGDVTSGDGEVPKAQAQDVSEPVFIDENVAKYFPKGYKSSVGHPHGASFWTGTARLDVECVEGSTQSYFLKTGRDEIGFNMMRSEYEGVQALYRVVPDLVPRPVGWGTYHSDANKHFYLAEYVPMVEESGDVDKLMGMLAKLHHDSIPHSPAGKFGFHVTTYGGTMPTPVDWCDTWEESYTANLKGFAEQERKAQGPSEDLDHLLAQLFEKVIPRLLRPLASNGRKLNPCLIHGDLWYGNIATNAVTGEPITFDPTVYWAHNEYELSSFPIPRYRLGRHYMRAYHRHMPISPPEEDYEDRILLYGIHGHFCASTLYPASRAFRDEAIKDIKYLVEKYPNGYEDLVPSGESEPNQDETEEDHDLPMEE